jgi:hypothetical protein
MTPLNLVFEDYLSHAVILKILSSLGQTHKVKMNFPLIPPSGRGQILKNLKAYNRASLKTPFLIVFDLDFDLCPQYLIDQHLQDPISKNLVVRVAVKSIESWILGDIDSLSDFLRVKKMFFPKDPDAIEKPKLKIIELAKKSSYNWIKEGLVPDSNIGASVGYDYNRIMIGFVKNHWNPMVAKENSKSLHRSFEKIKGFNPFILS